MKFTLAILIAVYTLLSIGGFVSLGMMNYYDLDGFGTYTRSYIPLRIAAAVLLLLVAGRLYKKYAQEAYEKRRGKWAFRILVPILVVVMFFVFNTGLLLWLNRQDHPANNLHIAGYLTGKNSRHRTKGGRDYFLNVTDTLVNRNYRFEVHRKVYNDFRLGDVFVKDMKIGRLAIIYREEE